jgi:hypothetical protein
LRRQDGEERSFFRKKRLCKSLVFVSSIDRDVTMRKNR